MVYAPLRQIIIRLSPSATVQRARQLSQAFLQLHKDRMLHQQTPIAHFESQIMSTDLCGFLGGRPDHQRMLVLQIEAMVVANNSSKTIARFRPSKVEMCMQSSSTQDKEKVSRTVSNTTLADATLVSSTLF